MAVYKIILAVLLVTVLIDGGMCQCSVTRIQACSANIDHRTFTRAKCLEAVDCLEREVNLCSVELSGSGLLNQLRTIVSNTRSTCDQLGGSPGDTGSSGDTGNSDTTTSSVNTTSPITTRSPGNAGNSGNAGNNGSAGNSAPHVGHVIWMVLALALTSLLFVV